jgi:hypothetical protein
MEDFTHKLLKIIKMKKIDNHQKLDLRMAIMTILIVVFSVADSKFHPKNNPSEVPTAKILFEDLNTICFQQKEIGMWCVDKTYKDFLDKRNNL